MYICVRRALYMYVRSAHITSRISTTTYGMKFKLGLATARDKKGQPPWSHI